MTDNRRNVGEVLFEFRQLGAQIRVAAIDPVTGIEVDNSIIPMEACNNSIDHFSYRWS